MKRNEGGREEGARQEMEEYKAGLHGVESRKQKYNNICRYVIGFFKKERSCISCKILEENLLPASAHSSRQ